MFFLYFLFLFIIFLFNCFTWNIAVLFNIDYFQVYVSEGLLIVSRETLPIILNSLPNKRLLKRACEGAGRPQSPANQLFHVEQSQIYTYKQITKHKYYKKGIKGAGRPQSPANQLFHVEQSQIYTYKQITKHKYYKKGIKGAGRPQSPANQLFHVEHCSFKQESEQAVKLTRILDFGI